MALKMRPTGLGHGVYKDVLDYGIFCGEWCIGRIYETRTGPPICAGSGRCTLPVSQDLRTDNRAATLDQAKAEFEASWKQWKAWAGMEEVNNENGPAPTARSDHLNSAVNLWALRQQRVMPA